MRPLKRNPKIGSSHILRLLPDEHGAQKLHRESPQALEVVKYTWLPKALGLLKAYSHVMPYKHKGWANAARTW